MANTLYDAARKRFLEAQINWMTDTIKIFCIWLTLVPTPLLSVRMNTCRTSRHLRVLPAL